MTDFSISSRDRDFHRKIWKKEPEHDITALQIVMFMFVVAVIVKILVETKVIDPFIASL